MIDPPVAVVEEASIETPEPTDVSAVTFKLLAKTKTEPPAVDTDEASIDATLILPLRDRSTTDVGEATPAADATIL